MPGALRSSCHFKHQHATSSPSLSTHPYSSNLPSYRSKIAQTMRDTRAPKNQSLDVTHEKSFTPRGIELTHDIHSSKTDYQLGFSLSPRSRRSSISAPLYARPVCKDSPHLDTSVMVIDSTDVLDVCWREILSSSSVSRSMEGEESVIDVDQEPTREIDVDEGYCDEMDTDAAIHAEAVWIQIHALITGDATQRASEIIGMRKKSALRSQRSGEVFSEIRPTVQNRIRMRKTSTTRNISTNNNRG
ncbi:putative Bgh-specific protein [Blumeria hordei DH14]|uniref:Putative Bgh-specific protein n=1 Tax=Blumeria graminis f. sp. hordei (strain DH14) TaxID=546991 RepID=N1JF00_BLUG1|nr:putative Bgh-specific protein [Blumeria hordei DH14]